MLTAIADVMAGFAISGSVVSFFSDGPYALELHNTQDLFWLILSTVGLYGGGVVFNDVFDIDLDRIERPERPLPSNKVSMRGAIILGIGLFTIGLWAAYMASFQSASIALLIIILALLYDSASKYHSFFGPLNMGVVRGTNLLLGMSVIPFTVDMTLIALIPVLYIGTVTLISKGEVEGGNVRALTIASLFYFIIMIGILNIAFRSGENLLAVLIFLIILIILVYPPLVKAIKDPKPLRVRLAVKAGVISIIALDAALAAAFAGWVYALLILLLLPISRFLSKSFAVT